MHRCRHPQARPSLAARAACNHIIGFGFEADRPTLLWWFSSSSSSSSSSGGGAFSLSTACSCLLRRCPSTQSVAMRRSTAAVFEAPRLPRQQEQHALVPNKLSK